MINEAIEGLWFSKVIPEVVVYLVAPLGLLVVGFLVEKNYVGRVTVFSNALAINIFMLNFLANPMNIAPEWAVYYANIALIMGIIGIIAYWVDEHLSKPYYTMAGLFGSVVTAIVIFAVLFSAGAGPL